MRPVKIFFLVLLLPFAATAQLEIGNRWYYTYYDFTVYPFINKKAVKCEILSDTVIAGRSCFKFACDEPAVCMAIKPPHFLLEEEGKICYWNNKSGTFETLYNFNLNEGDSYVLKTEDDSVTIHIDSVGYKELSGRLLKVQHVSEHGSGIDFYGKFFQGIGSDIFLFPEMGMCDPFEFHGLRCYSDQNGSVYFSQYACDSITTIEESALIALGVKPNPATNFLTIYNPAFSGVSYYEIVDITGKILIVIRHEGPETKVDVSILPPGVYILRGVDEASGKTCVKKLVCKTDG